MKVAVPWLQHSPMLGQLALSQTVCKPPARMAACTRRYSSPPGARTLSQAGRVVTSDGTSFVEVLHVSRTVPQELAAQGPVHDAVVDGEHQEHHRADADGV